MDHRAQRIIHYIRKTGKCSSKEIFEGIIEGNTYSLLETEKLLKVLYQKKFLKELAQLPVTYRNKIVFYF